MRYQYDRTHILKNQEVEIADDLSYVEEPVKNIGYKKNQLRNREIPIVKNVVEEPFTRRGHMGNRRKYEMRISLFVHRY